MDLGVCSTTTLVNFTGRISKYSTSHSEGLLFTFQKIHIHTILKCRAKHLQYKLSILRCVVKNIASVFLNVCPPEFLFPDICDRKLAEGIKGFNQSRLPLVCDSEDTCNSLSQFQVRRQLAACRFLKHLTPNGHYMGHTAQLTSRCCILYIYSTNIRNVYFKHTA